MNARTDSPRALVTKYRPVIHWALVKLAFLGLFASKANFTNGFPEGRARALPLRVWLAFLKGFLLDEPTLLFGRPVHLVENEGLRNPIPRDRILGTRRATHYRRGRVREAFCGPRLPRRVPRALSSVEGSLIRAALYSDCFVDRSATSLTSSCDCRPVY
jgi:hypothetical protein